MDFKKLLYKIKEQEENDLYEKFKSSQFGNSFFFKKKLNMDDDICQMLEVFTREEYSEEDKENAILEYHKRKQEEFDEVMKSYSKEITHEKYEPEDENIIIAK